MAVYRVLIVDDSRFMRRVLSDVVNADEAFTVASTAADGEEAVRLALELAPDIITMDLEMPRMNGLEALQRIMAVRPTPVIMLSAVTDNGARDTIKALQYGAFDFVRKPDNSVRLEIGEVSRYLLEKLHIAAETVRAGTLRMLPAVEENPAAGPPRPAHGSDPPGEQTGPSAGMGQEKTSIPPDAGKRPSGDGSQPEKRSSSEALSTGRTAPDVTPRPESNGGTVFGPRWPDTRRTGEAKVRPSAVPAPPARGTEAPARAGKPAPDPAMTPVNSPSASPPSGQGKIPGSSAFGQIVAVGASTGGPRALHELLTKLPGDLEAPILVVQHMPPKFTHSLAQRLNTFSAIRVREAVHGEIVETGTAYIAPGGKQMKLFKESGGLYRIRLTQEGARNGHMPSVDVLFESLVGLREIKRHVVLMTGMGSDGASGMMALRQDGAEIRIAESAETCVVYGMPRSAVEMGAVSHVLPLQQIAPFLVTQLRSRSQSQSP